MCVLRAAPRCSMRAVTQQAAMIAYIDDFWFMLFLTLLVTPLLLLIRRAKSRRGSGLAAQAAMD